MRVDEVLSSKEEIAVYDDPRFLLTTSNVRKGLFSKSSYAMSDRRRGINPRNLECYFSFT